MKKIILFVFVLASMSSLAQNRFELLFNKADSVFMEQAKKAAIDAAMETDSIFSTRAFYSCIMECEFGTAKSVTITWNDYLNEYMNGYMMGQLSFYYNKDFNYELLEQDLKKIKRELRKIKEHEHSRIK